ncbi:Kinesin-like protein KIF7 [Amphibalanus amphitrite]|uniref:Kinesin-like protein KIF7 n=1 Tax=Amphibalanus amphitrite TaxID=1232801 RepID=A0A6A4W8W6_AMPAM|nr:Kinesin-like protein KIF7 [Amphibalanus amphitrite]
MPLIGEPADASTPHEAASTARTAADPPQSRVHQVEAALVGKEAPAPRPPADGGPTGPGSADPPERGPDQRRSGVSADRETQPRAALERSRSSGATAAGHQGGGGARPRSPSSSSDPYQRRRRQACTEDDLRVLRDSDGLEALREQVTGGTDTAPPQAGAAREPPEPAATPAADTPVEPPDPDADSEPVRPTPDDPASIRREIQLLRDCRESLHNQRRRINSKLHQGRQLDAAETRRLLELDEAMHAVDEVLEHKACRLAGGAAPEDGRRLLLNQRQLMPRLLGLAAVELRLLYCRTFQRLVDQRIDGREKDLAVADLDAQTEEQVRGLKRLQRMVHDLMRERSHYRRQRDELRRRLHGPRGSGHAPLAAAAPPPPPPAAAAHGMALDPAAAAAAVQPAPLVHSRAPSDASSAPGTPEEGTETSDTVRSGQNGTDSLRCLAFIRPLDAIYCITCVR